MKYGWVLLMRRCGRAILAGLDSRARVLYFKLIRGCANLNDAAQAIGGGTEAASCVFGRVSLRISRGPQVDGAA